MITVGAQASQLLELVLNVEYEQLVEERVPFQLFELEHWLVLVGQANQHFQFQSCRESSGVVIEGRGDLQLKGLYFIVRILKFWGKFDGVFLDFQFDWARKVGFEC